MNLVYAKFHTTGDITNPKRVFQPKHRLGQFYVHLHRSQWNKNRRVDCNFSHRLH